jgi:hypothetical protein
MLIGPVAFLCLAGVVVLFDPQMVTGTPEWSRPEREPGVPAHTPARHHGRRPPLRARRPVPHSRSRTPQNR